MRSSQGFGRVFPSIQSTSATAAAEPLAAGSGRPKRVTRPPESVCPVGESADPHWRRLAAVWCELTKLGIDPVPLRARGLITPACGLAGYGATQAERVLGIARELAARVHDQAVAARFTLGA